MTQLPLCDVCHDETGHLTRCPRCGAELCPGCAGIHDTYAHQGGSYR